MILLGWVASADAQLQVYGYIHACMYNRSSSMHAVMSHKDERERYYTLDLILFWGMRDLFTGKRIFMTNSSMSDLTCFIYSFWLFKIFCRVLLDYINVVLNQHFFLYKNWVRKILTLIFCRILHEIFCCLEQKYFLDNCCCIIYRWKGIW